MVCHSKLLFLFVVVLGRFGHIGRLFLYNPYTRGFKGKVMESGVRSALCAPRKISGKIYVSTFDPGAP